MKRFTNLTLASSLLVLNLLAIMPVPTASAHGTGKEHNHETAGTVSQKGSGSEKSDQGQSQDQSAAYEFVTPEGGSLSLLTRRALQLHDEQKEDISLTPAAAIYAETNIVQELGNRLLEIGERVRIEEPLLDKYMERSQDLSPGTLATWNSYAAQANFTSNNITPAQSPSSTSKPGEQNQDDEQAKQETEEAKKSDPNDRQAREDNANRSSLPAFWWLAGITALAALYYLLGRRQND